MTYRSPTLADVIATLQVERVDAHGYHATQLTIRPSAEHPTAGTSTTSEPGFALIDHAPRFHRPVDLSDWVLSDQVFAQWHRGPLG